jgi:hypothetical protein
MILRGQTFGVGDEIAAGRSCGVLDRARRCGSACLVAIETERDVFDAVARESLKGARGDPNAAECSDTLDSVGAE